MFSLREFVKKGLLDAVGFMPDYKIRLNAAGWHDKGVLDTTDLAEISAKIDAHNAAIAESEETTEETTGEE